MKVAGGRSKLVNPRFQLRPLGAMVAYTVHNSRKKAISLSGLTRANGVFYTNWAYSRTTPPAVTDRRTIFASRGFTPIEGGKLQSVRRERTITYSDGAKHVSTSLLFPLTYQGDKH